MSTGAYSSYSRLKTLGGGGGGGGGGREGVGHLPTIPDASYGHANHYTVLKSYSLIDFRSKI